MNAVELSDLVAPVYTSKPKIPRRILDRPILRHVLSTYTSLIPLGLICMQSTGKLKIQNDVPAKRTTSQTIKQPKDYWKILGFKKKIKITLNRWSCDHKHTIVKIHVRSFLRILIRIWEFPLTSKVLIVSDGHMVISDKVFWIRQLFLCAML